MEELSGGNHCRDSQTGSSLSHGSTCALVQMDILRGAPISRSGAQEVIAAIGAARVLLCCQVCEAYVDDHGLPHPLPPVSVHTDQSSVC